MMATCKCVFLDGKEVFISVDKDAKGSDLFDSLCEYMGINNRDPFSIAYRGGSGPSPYNWWVRMDKNLTTQIPGKCKIWDFAFLVKYYPKALTGMQDETARYHVILQIRQDLLTGRLKCPVQTLSHLCSYWLQAQYGDWSNRQIDMQLAETFRFIQKGVQKSGAEEEHNDLNFEEQMMQIHRTHRGMSALEADYRFIRLAASLPNYGIHHYPAITIIPGSPSTVKGRSPSLIRKNSVNKAEKTEQVTIGVGPLGVHQYKRNGNETVFTWKAMRAVNFKKNHIVLKMRGAMTQNVSLEADETPGKKTEQSNMTKEYEFKDMYQTKIIWQVLIEYHMFFRVGDQKGLKGNQRKQLINSLKVKRTIPVVGEKKVEAFGRSATLKAGTSSKKMSSGQETIPKRASSLPPRPTGSDNRRSSAPIVSNAGQGTQRSENMPRRRSDFTGDVGVTDNKSEELYSGRGRSRQARLPRDVGSKPRVSSSTNLGLTTPMSGTFTFPQGSVRSRSSSAARLSINEEEPVLDGESIASENTDELCSPDVLGKTLSMSGYNSSNPTGDQNDPLTPRSQTSILTGPEVPKLDLGVEDNRKEGDEIDSPPQRFDSGPFVIPAEILVEDLRSSRNMKEEIENAETRSVNFPFELDEALQPRRRHYMKDSTLIGVYDHEFWKQAKTPGYGGRRSQSMASLRHRQKYSDARFPSRDRSTTPKSETMRERSLSPKSQSTRERSSSPKTESVRNRSLPPESGQVKDSISQPRIEKSVSMGHVSTEKARPQKMEYEERLKKELAKRDSEKSRSASHVAPIRDIPTVTPRKISTLPRRINVNYESRNAEKLPNMMRANPELTPTRPPRHPEPKGNTIPKIPIFIRSVV